MVIQLYFFYLCDDHEGEEGGEGEHHAGVLRAGAAAAEESEDEDDGAQDDEEDGGVDVGVVEVVQVVGHLKLNSDNQNIFCDPHVCACLRNPDSYTQYGNKRHLIKDKISNKS